MLTSPQSHRLPVIPGTRLLEDPLGLAGVGVQDPLEPNRQWTIQWMLAPVPGRFLTGVRAKLVDEKSFVTFCNQRDLEVLLGYGTPGKLCKWTGQDYPAPGGDEWFGFCCDEEDLRDDLFERECWLRQQLKDHPYLPTGLEITRRLHIDDRRDVEQLDTLLWDMDPETRNYPDPRLETVSRRWARVERNPLVWEYL